MELGYLALYFCGGVAVILGIVWADYRADVNGGPLVPGDPFLMAYLRGFVAGSPLPGDLVGSSSRQHDGLRAAMEIALLGLLLERKISADEDEMLRRAPDAHTDTADHPLKGAMLARLDQKAKAQDLASSCVGTPVAIGKELEQQLRDEGLLPNAATRKKRWASLAAGIAVLAVLAIGVLIQAGPTQLMVSSLAGSFVALTAAMGFLVWRPWAWRGSRALESAADSSKELLQRAAQFDDSLAAPDVLWLAAVFGVDVLPARAFPYGLRVFHRNIPHSEDEEYYGREKWGARTNVWTGRWSDGSRVQTRIFGRSRSR